MRHFLRQVFACLVISAAVGCGSTELPPATETPPPPSDEEMKRLMEESREKGGLNVPLPGEGDSIPSDAPTTP